MSTVPVGRYLRDVSTEPGRHSPIPLSDFLTMPDVEERQSEIDGKLEEVHIQGVLEGRAEAQAEYDRRLETTVADLQAAFARERAAWVTAQAELLAGALASELQRTGDLIADQVARVLQPFVEGRTREKAVSELRSLLDQMMFKGDFRKISVKGPEDLVSALKERIGDQVGGITYTADEAAGLTVSADETILEARISTWVDAIRGEAQ